MCVCTQSSELAHPHFWHKCPPIEEPIENPQLFKNFSNKMCMNKEMASNANNSVE